MFRQVGQQELLRKKKKSFRLKREEHRLSQLEKREEILYTELEKVKMDIEEQEKKIIDIKQDK
jgi:hypothetical protein